MRILFSEPTKEFVFLAAELAEHGFTVVDNPPADVYVSQVNDLVTVADATGEAPPFTIVREADGGHVRTLEIALRFRLFQWQMTHDVTLFLDGLRKERDRLSSLLASCPIGILCARKGVIVYANAAARHILGDILFSHMRNVFVGDWQSLGGEHTLCGKNGVIVAQVGAASFGDDETVVTIVDITEQKRRERELNAMVYVDSLTGLPNRMMFRQHADRLFGVVSRHGGKFAVIFVDIDDFKRINDTFGHHNGDIALRTVAERLLGGVRKGDMVCRYAGDEFVLLLHPTGDYLDVKAMCSRILCSIRNPFLLADGTLVTLTVSMGGAVFPDDADTVDGIVRAADGAMYRVKSGIKNAVTMFAEHMCPIVSDI